ASRARAGCGSASRPQHESHAAHRLDDPRLAVGLQLAAQVSDEHVYDVAVGLEVVAPNALEQLGAAKHHAGMPGQLLEQFELAPRQLDPAAAAAYVAPWRGPHPVAPA